MSILPKRRADPGPVEAPSVHVSALHAYLRAHPGGLPWTDLVVRFSGGTSEAAVALAGALTQGRVRPDYSGEYVLYYAAEDLVLPETLASAADAVVNFIAAHEDEARGSPDVSLPLGKVIRGLAPQYSPQQVVAAVEVLCKEALLWFRASTFGAVPGVLTLTLSRHQYFTVVAYDTDAHQSLCFHVRAGTKEVAIRKVNESAYGNLELKLMGVTQGYIEFSEVDGHSGMLVEQL